jgi:hypothetical protein
MASGQVLYLPLFRMLETARFEVFTAMKIQVVVFWVRMPCSDVRIPMFWKTLLPSI